MAIERLSGGLTPADGSDPRTFPSIWNATADDIEQVESDVVALDGRVTTVEGDVSSLDGRVTTVEGDVTDLQQGFRYAGTRYYTSSGDFEKADPLGTGDIGLRAIRVRMTGGGGAGGGATTTGANQAAVGGGGGGGAYAESFITDIAGLDSSVTVTRGAGGTGTTGAGNSGGQSSFGTVTANGGNGGGQGQAAAVLARSEPPGSGASAAAGDLTIAGSTGDTGIGFNVFGGLTTRGGGSALAGGSGASFTSAGVDGPSGRLHGGGGGGALNVQNQGSTRTGGAGGNGIVIIDCFV